MQVIDHARQAQEEWRPGVTTRMRVSAASGAGQLCVFEQWCAPGKGAPTHLHAVEEVITVLEGQAEFWVAEEEGTLTGGQSMVVPAGAKQLCVFEQWCAPGKGAPTHLHAVEEVITVLEGQAEFWIADQEQTLTAGQSMIVPAGVKHGFRNTGAGTLHVLATLAAPIFEAAFEDAREVSRRWLPEQRAIPR